MTAKRFHKLVDWVVKLAVLVLQVPVTWAVAGATFGNFGGVDWMGYRFEWAWILQACAVLLADGVLLSNWLALELDRRATPEVKSRYVVGAWVQFVVMLVIAFQHGEGLVGAAFRVSFAVALAGSTWDTIASTWAKLRRAVEDGGAAVDWRVRLHHRKRDRQEARYQRESEGRIYRGVVDAQETLALARLDADKAEELAMIADGKGESEQIPFPFSAGVTRGTDGERRRSGVSGG
jgi:hypothetical protein